MAKENQPTGMAHSALTVETTVTGNISASTDIRIDGILQGNLDCQGKVIIGEQGRVQGDIKAVNAEIMVTTLVIEPNAHLNGQCSMRTFQQ